VPLQIVLLHRVRGFFQLFLHQRTANIVIVAPAFVAGVVRRVNVDAVHLARVNGQQRLERVEIVAENDEVVLQRRLRARRQFRFFCVNDQFPERHGKMMRIDERLAFEIQCWHGFVFCLRG